MFSAEFLVLSTLGLTITIASIAGLLAAWFT